MKFKEIHVTGEEIEKRYHFSTLCSKLIEASGIDEDKIKELSSVPQLTTSQAQCVVDCVNRILKAKVNQEKVFVGGDYDADGICSTAIMKYTLDKLGIQNGYYIPDRLKEGYGLQSSTVSLAHEKGYSLLITVDNGVKCQKQIILAHELGMDIIVTDHHVIEETVPADIVVHPNYMEDRYSTLSGAGVALQISRHLIGDDAALTALAGVAAIGDLMPLWKETRAIVYSCLQTLKQGIPSSLVSLFDNRNTINVTSVAFQIVPKLNAIARMEDTSNVNMLVPFLLETRPYGIAKYVQQINAVNNSRKALSRSMTLKAESLIEDTSFIVLYDESFKQGLSGIVAGRLTHEYHKPSLIFSSNGEELVGSARSVEGLNIYDFFSDIQNIIRFGGHAMAAGITIAKDSYASFVQEVERKMVSMEFTCEIPEEKAVVIDATDLTLENCMELESLYPLPKELENIRFCVKNLPSSSIQKWSKVTKYHFNSSCGGFEGLVFASEKVPCLENPVSVTGKISINRYRNMINPQIQIEEMQ